MGWLIMLPSAMVAGWLTLFIEWWFGIDDFIARLIVSAAITLFVTIPLVSALAEKIVGMTLFGLIFGPDEPTQD